MADGKGIEHIICQSVLYPLPVPIPPIAFKGCLR